MTANPNPNQYMQNDMYLPKSFIQQQQYGHMPMGMYGMQNMMMMEHQNPQMFNQGVGMPPTQGMPNFPFGINEEGMKVHNKKMGKKIAFDVADPFAVGRYRQTFHSIISH